MPASPGRLPLILLVHLLAGCGDATLPAPPATGDRDSRPGAWDTVMKASDRPKGFIPASDPYIRYTGRFSFADPEATLFSWPGVVIEARFQGTSIKARLGAPGAYFDVFVDGARVFASPKPDLGGASLFVESTGEEYLLAKSLAPGEHVLRIERRSENIGSVCGFLGLTLDPGMGLLPLPERSPRRIEYIGDSYIAGFGNESPSRTSPGRQDESGRACSVAELEAYTNTQATYAVLAAKSLGAEYQVNAFSGLGMVRHYNGSTDYKPFQEYYRKMVHGDPLSPDYVPAGWIPGVVVIGLGANDFSTPLVEGEAFADRAALSAAYQARYRDFLQLLRGRYPGVKFILVATNLWPNDELKAQVKKVIEDEKRAGRADAAYFEFISTSGFGCAWHPDLATHLAGSRNLARLITDITGWQPQGTSIRR